MPAALKGLAWALLLAFAGTLPGCGVPADALAPTTPPPAASAPAAPEPVRTPEGTGGANALETLDKPYVVLVSFDGFRHDYLARYDTPSFDHVARTG